MCMFVLFEDGSKFMESNEGYSYMYKGKKYTQEEYDKLCEGDINMKIDLNQKEREIIKILLEEKLHKVECNIDTCLRKNELQLAKQNHDISDVIISILNKIQVADNMPTYMGTFEEKKDSTEDRPVRGLRAKGKVIDDASEMNCEVIRNIIADSWIKRFSTHEVDKVSLRLQELGISTDEPKTMSQIIEELKSKWLDMSEEDRKLFAGEM